MEIPTMSLGRVTRESFTATSIIVERAIAVGYGGGVRGRSSRQIRVAVALAVLGGGRARAEAQQPVGAGPAVVGTGDCPAPEAISAELATLLPADGPAAAGRVEIADLGPLFRVIVAGRQREYRDEGRDCAHRAQVAAVFVALTLNPASVATSEPTPTSAPPPTPVPPPLPPSPVPSASRAAAAPVDLDLAVVRLELGAAIDVGVGGDGSVAHPGVALRLAAGRGRLALTAGSAALAPVDATLGGVHLRQWRLPVDAGVRVHFDAGKLAPYAELGLGLTLVSERAVELATSSGRQYGTELGLRAAVGARLVTGARVTAFAALQAELVPSPVAIFALPRGDAGSTPAVWLGATVGGSLGVR
jgi:hypothetical protein